MEACIAELADGSVASEYLKHLLARCREWNGKIFVAEGDGQIAGAVCVFGAVPSREPDEEAYEYAHVSDLVVLQKRVS